MGEQLSQNALTAVTWTFTTLAMLATAGRFFIRRRTLQSADYLNGLALIVLVAYSITYTLMFPRNFELSSAAAGKGKPLTEKDLKRYFHLEIAVSMTFWVVLFLVKLSFMMLYRSIFWISQTFIRVWWVVFAVNVVGFLANFFAMLWGCGSPNHLWQLDHCFSETAGARVKTIVIMTAVLTVLTDILIMALPLGMLREIKISLARKVGLAFVFLLATIDITMDILRTVHTIQGGNIALDTLWDMLEATVAVIVCALPVYGSIVSKAWRLKVPTYLTRLTSSFRSWTVGVSQPSSRKTEDSQIELHSGDRKSGHSNSISISTPSGSDTHV